MREAVVYTVTQLNQHIKRLLLKDNLLQEVLVVGEISNYKHHTPSGHIYFTLKDENSILRCVFFRHKNRELTFIPAEGMRVLAGGNISLYERGGIYQLYIASLEPEGLGALYLAYEQLKERLAQEGLFEIQHKRLLPFIPQKIGLITSSSGAAVRDFLSALGRRFPCVEVLFKPAAVQGVEAPAQIIDALEKLEQEDLDVIVITRGGGSLEELWALNDEKLARAIFHSGTPVVSAVGHETDYTIADFVADMRASTPTAAAELITPQKDELLKNIEVFKSRLQDAWRYKQRERDNLLERFERAVAFRYPYDKINTGNQRLDELWGRLTRNISVQLQKKADNLQGSANRLNNLNPLQVLNRGFAFVMDKEKKPVNGISALDPGQNIEVLFRDGIAFCTVDKIRQKKLSSGEGGANCLKKKRSR